MLFINQNAYINFQETLEILNNFANSENKLLSINSFGNLQITSQSHWLIRGFWKVITFLFCLENTDKKVQNIILNFFDSHLEKIQKDPQNIDLIFKLNKKLNIKTERVVVNLFKNLSLETHQLQQTKKKLEELEIQKRTEKEALKQQALRFRKVHDCLFVCKNGLVSTCHKLLPSFNKAIFPSTPLHFEDISKELDLNALSQEDLEDLHNLKQAMPFLNPKQIILFKEFSKEAVELYIHLLLGVSPLNYSNLETWKEAASLTNLFIDPVCFSFIKDKLPLEFVCNFLTNPFLNPKIAELCYQRITTFFESLDEKTLLPLMCHLLNNSSLNPDVAQLCYKKIRASFQTLVNCPLEDIALCHFISILKNLQGFETILENELLKIVILWIKGQPFEYEKTTKIFLKEVDGFSLFDCLHWEGIPISTIDMLFSDHPILYNEIEKTERLTFQNKSLELKRISFRKTQNQIHLSFPPIGVGYLFEDQNQHWILWNCNGTCFSLLCSDSNVKFEYFLQIKDNKFLGKAQLTQQLNKKWSYHDIHLPLHLSENQAKLTINLPNK